MGMSVWMLSGLVPAIIAAAACWCAERLTRHDTAERLAESEPAQAADSAATTRRGFAPAVLSLGWAAAVAAGLVGQRAFAGDESSFWWPEDFWQRGYWWLLAAALVLGATAWSSVQASPGRWVAAGLLAVGTASTSLPAGEGWEDMLPLHRQWMLLLSGSCLLGFWSLDRLARRRSDRWFPLVVLALLGGPMMVAATTYGALAQWTLAAVSATLPCIVFALAGRLRAVIAVAYPAVAFATVMTAAGRFYSYEDPPWYSYLGMLLLAPAVAAVDRLIVTRASIARAAVAAGVAVAMITASALWHLGGMQ